MKKIEELPSLEEEIYKARMERIWWEDAIRSIQGQISYHRKRGNLKKVKELEKEIEKIRPQYEKARKRVNALYREWKKLRSW